MEVTCGESKRLSELFLLKSILLEKSSNNCQFITLVKSVHAIMLDSGFVLLHNPGSGSNIFSFSKKLFLVSLRYTLPELITLDKDTAKIESVTVNFCALNCTVEVSGIVGESSSRCKVVIDKCRFLPAINLVKVSNFKSDTLSNYHDVFVFWTKVKDGIVIPLLIDLYDKAGLELPSCLMRLPTELKLKILESLPGASVAKMACICTEMRCLASDNDLWKKKCLEEAKKYVFDHQSDSGSVKWEIKFQAFWKLRDVIKSFERHVESIDRIESIISNYLPQHGA